MKVLVCGGNGSGKSTVCQMFQELGVPVYNSDLQLNKMDNLLNTDPSVILSLKEFFGNDIYVNGFLDEESVANILMDDESKIPKLNEVLDTIAVVDLLKARLIEDKSKVIKAIVFTAHPDCGGEFELWCDSQSSEYVIEESTNAVDLGIQDKFDYVVVVTADEEIRVKRMIVRDNYMEEIVRARMNRQIPNEERLKCADSIIVNGDFEGLEPQVKLIHEKILNIVKSKL